MMIEGFAEINSISLYPKRKYLSNALAIADFVNLVTANPKLV
jgi:hypothetical protein